MNRDKIIVIFTILLIGQMTLLILFENLPYPFSTFYGYLIIWGFVFIILKPSVFFKKLSRLVYLFLLLYLSLHFLGIYNLTSETYNIYWLLSRELRPIFIAGILFTYFINFEKIESLTKVMQFTLIFILITSITSIIGLNFFPTAAREMVATLRLENEFELLKFYQRIGIASYDFYYGLAFTTPVFIFLIKEHWPEKKIRFFLIGSLAITLFAIMKSQMTTALIFSVIGILLSITGAKNLKKSLIILLIIVVTIVSIPRQFYINSLYYFSERLTGEVLQKRFFELAETIEFGENLIDANTHIAYRAQRIPFLIENISRNPITGGGESTGHVFWLDRLSLFGILGIIPWILFILAISKMVIKKIDKKYYTYYIISLILYIGIGFMKNSGHKLVIFFVFFVVPSILTIYSRNGTVFNSRSSDNISYVK